jgi:hypothetical protein
MDKILKQIWRARWQLELLFLLNLLKDAIEWGAFCAIGLNSPFFFDLSHE